MLTPKGRKLSVLNPSDSRLRSRLLPEICHLSRGNQGDEDVGRVERGADESIASRQQLNKL